MHPLKFGIGVVIIVTAFLMMNCTLEPLIAINMHPFITMAKGTDCADRANNLYAIDDSM